MRNKYISGFLRALGLAWWADYVRFQILRFQNRKKNQTFRVRHPDIVLPPDYTLYESFQMDYAKYYLGGREDAKEILERVSPYCNLRQGRILDWGCGPARLIRHFPDLLEDQNEYFGTDYNSSTVAWCQSHIKNISFSKNEIQPPLAYPSRYFDLIYGISIFTHLSLENHFLWSNELHRISKPEGVVLVTTHGKAFLERLTREEQIRFKQGELVPRTKVREGHRMYAAFQPPEFMQRLFEQSGFDVIQHAPGTKINEDYISQDIWVLKQRRS